jgi:hypothetical protein
MKRCCFLLLPLVICLCASCQTPEQRAVSMVLDFGGKVKRDENLPGRPVVEADLSGNSFRSGPELDFWHSLLLPFSRFP